MPIDFQGQDVDDTDLIGKRQGKGGNLDELPNFFRRLTCVVTAKIHLPKNERSHPRSDSRITQFRFPRPATLIYFPTLISYMYRVYTTKVTPTYVHIAPSHVFDLLFTRTRTILRAG